MSKKIYTSAKMVQRDFKAAHKKYRISLLNWGNEELINHAGEIYAEKKVAEYLINCIDYDGERRNRVLNTLLGKPRLDWADYISLVRGFARVMVDPDFITEGGLDDVLEDVIDDRDWNEKVEKSEEE